MCCRIYFLLSVVFTLTRGRVGAQLLSDSTGLDARFQEDQRVETDTALGQFSIGVSGISEHEKLGATRGDIELGYRYEYEFDTDFPRIAEFRPFFFNRAETTETSYYESLGFGAGLRFSLREKYEENNWFVRLSILTPTDTYRERYDLGRNQSSLLELFAGFEVPFNDADLDRDMRERLTAPTLIEVVAPAVLFDPAEPIDPRTLERVHTLMIGAYLTQVSLLEPGPPLGRRNPRTAYPELRLIERLSQVRLSEAHWLVLTDDAMTDPAERVGRRRAIVAEFIRRGLTQMMRGDYPLIFKPAQGLKGQAAPPGRSWQSVGRISRPGVKLRPSMHPLDADTMIEHFIAFATAPIQ